MKKLLLLAIGILILGIVIGFFGGRKFNPHEIDLTPADSIRIIEAHRDTVLKEFLEKIDKRFRLRNQQYKQIEQDYDKNVNRIYSNDEQRYLLESIRNKSKQARSLRDTTGVR